MRNPGAAVDAAVVLTVSASERSRNFGIIRSFEKVLPNFQRTH
jgi:hypothetical protein